MAKIRITVALLTVLSVIPAMAQMNNTVDVEHVYKPEIKDANRISISPEVRVAAVKRSHVDYVLTSSSLKNYAFTPIWAVNSDKVKESVSRRFVTLGGGTEGNILGRAAVEYELNEKHVFDVELGLSGHNANVEHYNINDEEWKSRFYSTTVSAGYEFKINSGSNIFVDAAYENQVYNYQQDLMGNANALGSDKQHNTLLGFSAGITPYSIGDFFIAGGVGYEQFSQKYVTNLDEKCREGFLSAYANVGYEFNKSNSIDFAVSFANSSYFGGIDGYTNVALRPHYRWNNDDMDVKVGLYIGTLGIAPDISFSYHMAPSFDLYADVTGGEACTNTFRTITAANPYWTIMAGNDDFSMEQQFDQLSARIGIRATPFSGVKVETNTGYELSKDRVEFAPLKVHGTNVYSPFSLVDGGRFYITANASYAYKDRFVMNMLNQFNVWSVDDDNAAGIKDVLWRPMLDIDWSASFRIFGGLRAGAEFRLQTFKDKDEYEYTRPTTANLCASLSYTLSQLPLTVYVKGNNLLNQDYDSYIGYRTPGTNVIAGAAITF